MAMVVLLYKGTEGKVGLSLWNAGTCFVVEILNMPLASN